MQPIKNEKKKEIIDKDDVDGLSKAGFNNISQLYNQPKFIKKKNSEEQEEDNEKEKEKEKQKENKKTTRFDNSEYSKILMRQNNN